MKRTLLAVLLSLTYSLGLSQLTTVSNFGSNPGNLGMFIYTPSNMPADAPVVMALHGCTQNASSFASETDWNKLADQYKFYVIYPEQRSSNNSSGCFNWFENGDKSRGFGEAASLNNMVTYLKNNYSVDDDRVFVTGFSAGGAMASIMLATYPEVFASGAVMSGLPYDVATGTTAAFQAMFGNVNLSPAQLGNRVRNASSFSGDWPTVAIFHGTSDFTVYYANEQELIEQWTNVQGIDQTADLTDNAYLGNSNVLKKEFQDASGTAKVVSYSFNGMGHAVAIDPGTGTTQGGNTGSYTSDEDFWSSYYAAEFFGLLGPPPVTLQAPDNLVATAVSSSQIDLTWNDNEANETQVLVQRSGNAAGPFTTISTLAANSTSYSDGGLTASTPYFYQIRIEDGSGNAATSTSTSATTQSDGTPTPPNAPTNLTATVSGGTNIDLSWTDASTNEDGFQIERSTGDASNYTLLATVAANATSYTDANLANSTTYFYRVRAFNTDGNSPFTAQASATTAGQATLVEIDQPLGSGVISYFNNVNTGQSFTAPVSGELISIDANLYLAISGSTLRIYAGNTTSGTPLYEQSSVNAGSGWQTISLTTPLAVSQGQVYTFQLTSASIRYNFSNVYAGGNFWYNSISYTVFDAAFGATFSTTSGSRLAAKGSLSLHAYPNPTRSFLTIEAGGFEGNSSLSVMDLQGRTLLTQIQTDKLDVTGLAAGMYWLVLHTDQGQLVKQFRKE
ncbi:PHB depolymerase family esterase [Pontibacter sp. G13]|uniref:extracellular catalytic domain type 1 short-chain-length polyhydroxyalkanoate depolymerase n=1 Tax=Pontibacter sp. G13 TaxID=3074898 RepID=UPI0028896990|nr:PHB depolymerase family esterase [Pontibacter sp. G13]WNJ17627.1 PHB depolymerase family esterase [Pontibacter sp. G13]